MRVICVVVLLIAAAQGAVLDINRCKLDGENACRDYSTAAKCQTSNYCKAEIWGRATDPSKTCQKCLNDIKTIQTFVDSKSTREFVRNDLNALCDLCPYETGRTECKSLIKSHFDEIYQDIVDKLDPNTICRALRLCQQTIAGSEMRETPSEIKVAAANILMKKLEEEHYAKVAPWMPGPVIFLSLVTKCKDYTTAKAFGVLENCKAFWSAPTKDDDICEECKKEIAKLQNWVKSEKTKDEIKKDILMFCDKIPFQAVKDECHTLIAEGFDMIYDDIIAMLDPGTLCTGMKFCNSINVDDMRKATCNLNGNNACLDYTTAASCKATNYCKAEIWSRPVQNTKFCDMCLEDVGNLQKFIDANSTREFVQKDLLALCKLLPWKQFSYKCQTTVIKNFEEIYDDIVKMLDPKAVCRALFICQSKIEGNALPDLSLTRIDEKIPKSVPEDTLCTIDSQNACRDISTAKKCNALSACGPVWSGPTKDNVYCDMCKIEIGKLQDWMKKQTSKALVKKDLEEFCTEIPLSAFEDACTQLVDEDFDTIYDQILTALDPSAVCTAIKLCTLVDIEEHLTGMMDKLPEMLQEALTDNKFPIAAPFKPVNSDSCMDCEAFIKDFQNVALNNKKIVNDWMTMLKTECKTLGAGIGELCEQNVDMVIYNVMMKHKNNADDPMSVCKTIMMCDQFNQKRVGDMCTDCKTFFKDWQDMLKSNSSAVDQVVDALAKFYCLQKPEELRDQCARYVAMVIRVFIERIKDEDVGKICTEIEFCDPKKEIPAQKPDLKKLAKKISKIVLQSMPKREHQVGSDMCMDCKNFITDLQGVIMNNKSLVQELVDLVKQECESLGPELGDICKELVHKNYEEILKIINSIDPDTICNAIMMCGEFVKPKLTGDLCTDCQAFFSDWQNIITNNQSIINELNNLIADQCSQLGPEFSKLCDTVVKEYLPQLWDLISSTDPEEICSAALFCESVKGKEVSSPPAVKEHKKVSGKSLRKFAKRITKVIMQSMPEREPQVGSDMCMDCKNFITDLQGVIMNNKSLVQELVDLVKQECEQLGPELGDVCKALVESNYDQVLKAFSALDADTICMAIMMCGEKTKPAVGGDLCTDCQAFFSDWQNIIINNQSFIDDNLPKLKKTICENVSFLLREECDHVFDEVAKELIEDIKKNDPEEICSAVDFCESEEVSTIPAIQIQPALKIEEKIKGDDYCMDCTNFIGDLQNALMNDKTLVQKLVDLVKQQCDQLGSELALVCKGLVEDKYEDIIKAFESYDVDTICEAIMMCSQQTKQSLRGDMCMDCQKFAADWQNIIANNKTIIDTLLPTVKQAICNEVPSFLKGECDKVFDEVSKEIIDAIQNNDPEVICDTLYLCDSVQAQPAIEKKIEVAGDVECQTCKFLVEEVEKMVQEDKTEAAIESALMEICNLYGEDIKQDCMEFMQVHGASIIDFILAEMNSLEICAKLGLCKEAIRFRLPEKEPEKENVKDNTECEVCTLAMTELFNVLEENSTVEQIETELEKICSDLPESYQSECKMIIEQYTPELIEYISQKLTPKEICEAIKLCTSSVKKENVKDNTECEVCTLALTELFNVLEENATVEEIEKELEKICADLPESYQSECKMIIEQYTPELIEYISQKLTPEQICEAIKLCTSTVIKENVKDNTECEVCTLALTEVFNVLEENATVEEVEKELEKICADLPESYQSECKMIIEQYTPELIEYISQKLTPEQICEAIKLCTSSVKKESVKDNTECEVCTLALTEVFNKLEDNATAEEIEKELEKLCSDLPDSYQSECKMIIEQYTPQIIEYISQKLTPKEICEAIKLCTSSVKKENVKDNTGCEICTLALTELFNKLEDNATEEEIEKELEKICSDLPESYQSECKMIIEQYTPELIELITQKLTPKEICEAIKLCTSYVKKENVKYNTGCEICTLALTELFNKLEDNATEEEIEKELEKICSDLPESYQSECKMIIEQYTPELIELITQKLTPKEICEAIKLCTSVKKVESGITCLLCTDVVGYLVKNIPVNQTEESILKELRVACSYLKKYEDKCDEFVNDYGKEIVDLILKEVTDPKKICFLIGLCGLPVEEVQKQIEENLKSDTGCELCEVVVKQLDSYLTEDATQAKFIEVFEKVCADLPESDRAQCKNFVQTYTPTLLDLLVQELAPNEICALIKLCNSETTVAKIAHQNVKGEVECEVCTLVISEAQKMLEDDATEAEIVNELNKACQILPEKDRDECASFVDAYAKEILDLLAQKLDAKTICTEIKLCAASMKKTERENVKGEVECELCTVVISEAQKLLEDDATEQEILDAIGKVCPMLEKYEDECNTIVHEYGPTLLKLLAKELSPAEICTEVKLCVSKTIKVSVTSAAECEVCTLIATELDKVLSEESTQAEIEAALKEVCDVLPDSVKDTCNGLVTQYGTEIVNLLVEEFKPDMICVQLDLCQSMKENLKVESITSSAECEVCTLIATELDKVLSEESTQEEIEAALKEVCDVLPDSVKDTCNGLVTQYGTEIVNLLVEEFKPDMICVQLDLCQSTKEILKVESITSSAECEVCTLIATELDKVLSEESTQEEIEAALKEVCDVLPDSVKDTCNGLVTQYGTEIVNLLVEEFKPDMICVQLDLCQSTKEILKVESITSSAECEVCTLIATELDKVLSEESTQEEIEAALKEVCDVLPDSVKDTCNGLVTQYGTEIVNLLVEEFKPDMICVQLDLCQSTKKILKVESITSSAECEVCTLIATELDKVLSEESTQEEIEAALKEVCDVLPDSVKDTCNGLVTQYGTEIVNLLVEEFKPDMICVQLDLCQSTKEILKVESITSSAECEVCTLIATELDNVLSEESTQEQIEAALKEVCDVLPDSVKDTCNGLVTQYGTEIVNLLVEEFKPDMICVQLDLCQSTKEILKVESITSSAECEVCTLIATELDKVLSEESTQEEIEAALKEVCDVLPDSVKDTCNGLVTQYGTEIVNLLVEEFKPDMICVQLDLCQSTKEILKVESITSSAECEVCTLIATELDKVLSEESTQEEIEAALKEVCDVLPDSVKDTCNGLVTQYGTEIVNLLVEEFKPDMICVQLDLCQSTKKILKVESITSSAECEVCTLIATELDKVLSEESTQEEIEAALKEVCNVLPDSVKDTCNGLVTQYGTEIVNLLVEEFKPDMICVQLDLCQSTKEILKVESITSSAECEVCTLIATELDKVLSEESTQEEIEAALKEVCNVLPDSVKDTCNGLVTQYGTEIVNLLVEEFKPDMICVQLDLCQSTKEILKVESITSSAECEVCTLIATELDNVLSEKSTQDEIEAALKEVCDVLPDSVKDTCNGLVTQYGTEIVNLLVEEFKPDKICVQLNLCKSMEENLKKTDVTDNTVCDVCNMIANYIDSQLNVSSTQDEIKKVLNEVCGFIPSEFKDTCTGLVNQNFDQIIKFLLQEFRPDVICVQLELCQSSTSFKKGPTIETCEVCRLIAKELGNMLGNTSTQDEIEDALKSVCKRLGPDFEGTCDNAVSTFYPQFMKVLLKELNPDVLCTDLKLCIKEVQKKLIAKSGDDEASCVFCEFFAKQLDNVLKEDATKEEIKAALSEACAIIPDKYKSQCNIFVEQFGDSVYAILVEEMNPGKICPDLGICPKTFKNEKISPEVTCDVCKFLVVEIEQLLTKNQTEEEVVGAMLEICAILPDAQKEECTNLITNYGATLYKLLLTILGKDVCPMIGVCNKSMEFMSDKKMRLNEEKLSECTICEVVMDGLKRILSEKPTEQEILNAVNKVCDIVPEKYRSVCHQYINDYAPGVINIIIDDFSPDQVCAKLHACSTINKTPVKLHFRSDKECTICKTVIKEVDNLLDQNITRQEIEKALDKVCTELPSMADECEALINQYAPIIFKYMDNILDPSFICQKMKLCPTEKILLGADPCTYGPSYWCINLDTAKQCNAVQHCLNHLWE
uniref:uncharacterized protein LOC120347581 isoform X5 n=1 Tax=Styela clava TaxID=7725 RepID=UPI001939F7C4|nr:uncharacterized protein LOC120347581 isoform X5 [Styela clava]